MTDAMNILWLSHNVPYPPKTGVLQRNYNLIKEASRIGNIYLLAFFQKDILPIAYDLDEARRELGRICSHVDIVRMPTESSRFAWHWLVLRSVFTRDPYSVNWLKSDDMRQMVRRLLDRGVEFDAVHFDTMGLAEYRTDFGAARLIMNHHNIESHLMARRSRVERNPLKRAYYAMEARKIERYEAAHAGDFDVHLTVSDVDKALLAKVVPEDRIAVVPNGVDTAYFSRGSHDAADRSVIFVGGMNWYPNRDAVTYLCREIWPMLSGHFPDTRLA